MKMQDSILKNHKNLSWMFLLISIPIHLLNEKCNIKNKYKYLSRLDNIIKNVTCYSFTYTSTEKTLR